MGYNLGQREWLVSQRHALKLQSDPQDFSLFEDALLRWFRRHEWSTLSQLQTCMQSNVIMLCIDQHDARMGSRGPCAIP